MKYNARVNKLHNKVVVGNNRYAHAVYFIEYCDNKSDKICAYENQTTPKLYFNNFIEAEYHIRNINPNAHLIVMDFRDVLSLEDKKKNTT